MALWLKHIISLMEALYIYCGFVMYHILENETSTQMI